ncbi:5'-methylthioadenosine phosphorylase (EC [Olavius algarvensis Delta 1 endosymbiont]|nr:5'-methylthioadenosine phosphorylase (EC [Olavius algarvensis Delta 1 endosymbiont]
MKSVAVILGSAFQNSMPPAMNLEQTVIQTAWGKQVLYHAKNFQHPAYLLFRHGLPHRLLPHQINYRSQADALAQVGCGALLVTSSVGVLDPALPLFRPMLLTDLIMLDNRLPDGSTCTMFTEPSPRQGHLVVSQGLFSWELNRQIHGLAGDLIYAAKQQIVFAYVAGPRTKTPAESRIWRQLDARVNSMTLAPEIILANELEISCTGLVVGHKYSTPDIENIADPQSLSQSLDSSKAAMQTIVLEFLENGKPVSFGNQLYRFDDD